MSAAGQVEKSLEQEHTQKVVNFGLYIESLKIGYFIGESIELKET